MMTDDYDFRSKLSNKDFKKLKLKYAALAAEVMHSLNIQHCGVPRYGTRPTKMKMYTKQVGGCDECESAASD